MKISLNTVLPTKQNIGVSKKNTNSAQASKSKNSTNSLNSLDYSALVNKAGMSAKNNISFCGKCLIDKNAWNNLTRNEKFHYWVQHSELFGLNNPFSGRGDFAIFHEDLNRLKTRIDFVNKHFPEKYYEYIPLTFGGDTYYYDCVQDLGACFCDDDAKDEKKRLSFAVFLRNKPGNEYGLLAKTYLRV